VAVNLADPSCVARAADAMPGLLGLASVLIGNAQELSILLGAPPSRIGEAVRSSLPPGMVVAATMGGDGVLLTAGGRTEAVPARRVDRVADTTGAGDSWTGAFLLGLADGMEPRDAAAMAAEAAAAVVSRIGAHAPEPLAAIGRERRGAAAREGRR